MQKVLVTLVICMILFAPVLALAQAPTSVISLKNPLTSNTFEELVDVVINWLLLITLPIITLLIVYAGFQIMISGADPKQREGAINMIKYALIGYGAIILSKVLVGAIKAFFQ